mmetsp:Transcript_37999/g.59312  ORF Transcript_37999/g.59312 Transcript_37999/m.59312 type:complete len:365 (-) Transcript_37999:46-1140(-)
MGKRKQQQKQEDEESEEETTPTKMEVEEESDQEEEEESGEESGEEADENGEGNDETNNASDEEAGGEEDKEEDEQKQEEEAPKVKQIPSDGSYRNKQRCLVFSTRGVTSRHRHLLADLRRLMPHHKKDAKLDIKGKLQVVNEIAEMKSCNGVLFLEARKRLDLYLWAARAPQGPSAKFLVNNVHTMDELRLTGNALLGSRPFLAFDAKFQTSPHWQLIKSLLGITFGTPRGHPKSKPFIDRVMSFAIADGKVWVRNFQILDQADGGKVERAAEKSGNLDELTSLVEIGPRFVLTPIRIFDGSFGGATLYQNPAFVSPNAARAQKRRKKGLKYTDRQIAKTTSKERAQSNVMPKTGLEMQTVFSG